MKNQNQKSTEEHQPIRLKKTIVDPREIRRVATKLGFQSLVSEAHQRIHSHADNQPDRSHVVTTKEIDGGTGFLVGMVFANGLLTDFALQFEVDSTMSPRDAVAQMEQLAEDYARRIFEHKYQGENSPELIPYTFVLGINSKEVGATLFAESGSDALKFIKTAQPAVEVLDAWDHADWPMTQEQKQKMANSVVLKWG